MPTKIYNVDILVEDRYKIENWPLKKLPIHILIKCERFIEFIEARLKEKGITLKKKPEKWHIEIEYLKFISNVNTETYPDKDHQNC